MVDHASGVTTGQELIKLLPEQGGAFEKSIGIEVERKWAIEGPGNVPSHRVQRLCLALEARRCARIDQGLLWAPQLGRHFGGGAPIDQGRGQAELPLCPGAFNATGDGPA